jgi:hypothetical protein
VEYRIELIITIETKNAARIGYNGFLFPYEYSTHTTERPPPQKKKLKKKDEQHDKTGVSCPPYYSYSQVG